MKSISKCYLTGSPKEEIEESVRKLVFQINEINENKVWGTVRKIKKKKTVGAD